MFFDELQFLMFRVSDWENYPAAFGKLRKERLGNRGSGSSDEDGVERSKFRQAKRAITAVNMRVCVPELRKLAGSRGCKLRSPFDCENLFDQS